MNLSTPGWFALGGAVIACQDPGGMIGTTTGTTVGTIRDSGSAPTGTPCGPGGTTSFAIRAEWVDDGGTPATGSCGDRLEIVIVDPLGMVDWEFGLVDTGVGGWTGEDCLTGGGAAAFCHPVGLNHTLVQVPDCQVASVFAGTSTWFDASREPQLTYYAAQPYDCFTWGADPAYYASLGCYELC